MDRTLYDVIVVGAGPAGVVFSSVIRENTSSSILLVDADTDYCASIKKYNTFYKNFKSLKSEEYDILLQGDKDGADLYRYFHKKYGDGIRVEKFEVVQIEKKDNLFYLRDGHGKSLTTKVAALATGVRRKTLEILSTSDITLLDKFEMKLKAEEYGCEVIFIGSGDNAAIKSIRLCKLFEIDGQKDHRVTIIAKPSFFERINPRFHEELRRYEEEGILRFIYTPEKAIGFKYLQSGLVSEVLFEKSSFKIVSNKGCLVGVYIGFEPNLPLLTNCSKEDLLLIGDIQSLSTGEVVSLTDAVSNAEIAAHHLLSTKTIL